jgi:phage-related minor tail protein
VTTGAGSLDILVTADTAEASSSLSKFAANAEREMSRTEKANASAKKQGDAFIASLQRQVDTFGLTGAEIQKYEARLKGASAAADPLIDRLNKMRDAQAAFNVQAASMASSSTIGKTGEGIKSAAHEMEGFSFATAGAKRELLVLAHELSQGNYKRFAGSVLVLGERTGAAALLFSAMGIAALGSVAAVAALAVGIYKGAEEQKKFNEALLLTGNAAGQTSSSFDAMTKSIAGSSGETVGKVREIGQAFLDTGRFGPAAFDAVTRAAATLQKASGESAEDVVKHFEKMTEGATKWAEETNKQYHFLDVATYEQIRAMEDQGRAQEAMTLAADAFDKSIQNRVSNLGYWERAWHAITGAVAGAVEAVKSFGKADTTDQQIAGLQKTLADRQARGPLNSGTKDAFDRGNAALQAQIEAAQDKKREESRAASHQAEVARINEEAIAGSKLLNQKDLEYDKLKRMNKELDENKRAFAAVNAGRAQSGAAPIPQADLDKLQTEVRAKYEKKSGPANHAQAHLDNAYTNLLDNLGKESAKLDAEIAQWTKYGHALDNSREATTRFSIEQGKLVGKNGAALTQPQKDAAINVAKQDDAKQQALNQLKAAEAADKFIAKLKEEADAHAMNARQQDLSNRIGELDRIGIEKGTAAYEAYVVSIKASVNAKHDQFLINQLAAQQLKNDDEINKLDEQTNALGKGTLARLEATAVAHLYNDAQKELADPANDRGAILDSLTSKTNALTAALKRNYDASRSFQTGAATAFTKYQEDSANAGKFAENVVGGGLTRLEDSLVKFAETGKLSFSSLFQFMADEFIRQQVRMLVASQTSGGSGGGGGGGLLGIIGSLAKAYFGGADTGLSTADYATSGFATGSNSNYGNEGIHLATGTNFVPYDGMPAVLHKGEAVVPAAYNPANGGGADRSTNITINNNAPVKATAQTKQRQDGGQDIMVQIDEIIAQSVANGGKTHDAIQKRFGLNAGGSTPRY